MSDNLQPVRPASDNTNAWHAYWADQGMPWRTEPEISVERQMFLAERRTISVQDSAFPFQEATLNRADVEWLLATRENGLRTIKQGDSPSTDRVLLDLRGADLRRADLAGLPLDGVDLSFARLESANLAGANLDHASLDGAHMEGANLARATLRDSSLMRVHLEGADLDSAQLPGSRLHRGHLERAYLHNANLEFANLTEAHLESSDLTGVSLNGADLSASFLHAALLTGVRIAAAKLADVRWGDTNIAGIDWARVQMIGDERIARQRKTPDGRRKSRSTRITEYREAIRAYRGLLPLLTQRELDDTAERFSYRAQILQRQVSWMQGRLGAWYGSLVLDLSAGYGYKPQRLVLTYLVIVAAFAAMYYSISQGGGPPLRPLTPIEAYLVSLQVVIGRNVPFTGLPLSDPVYTIADIEIVVSLVYGFIFANVVSRRLFGGRN